MVYYGYLNLRQCLEWIAVQNEEKSQEQNQQVSKRNDLEKDTSNGEGQQGDHASEGEHHGQHPCKHEQTEKIFLSPCLILIAQVCQKAGVKWQDTWTGSGQKSKQQ